jgi:hypothetical protein
MEKTLVFVTREEYRLLQQQARVAIEELLVFKKELLETQKQVVELERRLSVFVSRYRHVATGELAAADDYLQRPRTLETRESKRQ